MKAIVMDGFGGPEVMSLDEVARPVPGPEQVLIKVNATSVNRPDIVQRQGHYPPAKGESEILGLEVAGVIESVGSKDSRWRPGDRVMALVGGGGYAQYALAYADHAMKIPEIFSDEQAACICETYITAWLNVLKLGDLQDGESVLIHGGGGGVSTAAIQLVQQLRPKSRIFVTASPAKIDSTRSLGVDDVIDYKNKDFADEIKTATGKGVNVILDHIGAQYLKANLQCLAVEGRLIIIGVMGGAQGTINLARMMVKRQRILGSVLRSRSKDEKASLISQFVAEVLPCLERGDVIPLIDSTLSLSEASDAHRKMESSRHTGKIVLSVG